MTPRPPRERAIAAAHPAPAALADLEQRYRQALETFVEQDGGEEVLHEAHELGRFAVARGFGLLDVLAIHHAALRSLAAALPGRHDSADLASKTEEFLAQVVVLFEMTHRGWNERRADAKFRLLFDRNPQPMWAFDREDLRFLEVNIAAIAHYGYSRAEFAEMRVTDLRPAEDVPAFVAYREAARAKPPGYRTAGEWRHKLKNGRIIDVEIAAHDIELLGRKATLVVVKDITEQKRAQAALLESEARERDARQRLESILDRMPMGCVVGDKDLRFTYWNPAAERIFGYKFEEVKGLHPFETNLVAGDRAEAEAKYARLRRGEAEGSSTTYNRTKDGRRIKCEWQNMPLLGVDGSFQGVIAMCQDITQRAETEEALQQALKMEAIGQLTGGVAHDFNNLLTVVMGNLELLERSLEGRAEDLSLLNAILAAAARGADLTRQLLAFSRRQTLEPQIVAVNKLVGGVTRLLARTLGENIEIKLVPAEDLWPVVVDPALLESALANLAINARDAMPDGGTLIIETMNTQLDQLYAAQNPGVAVRDYVALAISDTGTGMPHEVLARVFEPFFTTKEKGKGTGLGLSMVYGFVKQSDGHIKIYSEVGHGTTVRLFLPRAEKATDAPLAAPTPEAFEGAKEGETILLVEDDQAVRDGVSQTLRHFGFRVVEAADGPTALELLAQNDRVDLLFTDLVMPGGMNGVELAEQARKERPGLKLLFTSGYAEPAVASKLSAFKDAAMQPKPYRIAALVRKIREAIDRPKPLGDAP